MPDDIVMVKLIYPCKVGCPIICNYRLPVSKDYFLQKAPHGLDETIPSRNLTEQFAFPLETYIIHCL